MEIEGGSLGLKRARLVHLVDGALQEAAEQIRQGAVDQIAVHVVTRRGGKLASVSNWELHADQAKAEASSR